MPPKKTGMAESMETLYFKHYDEHVAKHGERTAILLQVGKFFELYDSVDVSTGISRANVQAIIEICGTTVEPKATNDPNKQRIFWGFPEIALAKFERIIVSAGYTVVIIVQTKDATDRVVSRTVERISSPGTFWDEEGGLAIRKEEQIMLGVYIEPYTDTTRRIPHWYVGSTAFDVMTGKLVSTETDLILLDGKPVLDTIQPFWSMYPPAEVVIWWCAERSMTPPSEESFLGLFLPTGKRPLVHIHVLEPKCEMSVANQRIQRHFLQECFAHTRALSVDEYLGIEMYHFIRRSLYHLLSFVNDHNRSFLQRLNSHSVWTPEEHCILGNSALEQLAMIPTNIQKPHESLLYWLQKTTTTMGKRALRERIMKPLTDVVVLNQRQVRIAALRATPPTPLITCLRRIHDLPRLFRRFQIGHGTVGDLLELLTSYKTSHELLEICKGTVYESLQRAELQAHIQSLLGMWDIERIRKNKEINSELVGLYHPWKRGIHASLDRYEDSWMIHVHEIQALRTKMESVLEETDVIVWTLKEDAPFTLTATNRRAKSLAAVAVRRVGCEVRTLTRASSPNTTLETDSIVAANQAALRIRSDWKADVEEQWKTDWAAWFDIHISNGMIQTLVDTISDLDVELTLALVSEKYGYVRPEYIATEDIEIAGLFLEEVRHPIIERIHTDTPYIPHTIAYGVFADSSLDGASAASGTLIYGVNASGKSSLGKAIGLAVLMAQCGMPVPATRMKLIPYNALYTRILGNDNLWAGMSSFVVEMTEFRSILRSAASRVLVVGDELCAGTETASATAIVAAGIQTLVKRGCHFFFATHLHELAAIPEIAKHPNISIYHLSVTPNLEDGSLVYDRHLRPGCGSPMYGLEVCRGLDMDSEFLTLAYDLRKRLFRSDGTIIHTSRYNADVVVAKCSACGGTEGLETHHIVPQAAADTAGIIQPGKHKNSKDNLAVLCESCHTKHHNGDIEIRGWEMTSFGKKLVIRDRERV